MFVLAALVFPLLAAAIAVIYVVGLHRRGRTAAGIGAIAAVTVLFGYLNQGKAIAGDWAWYVEHYRALEHLDLADYLGRPFGWITPAPTEPVYYSVASVLARASHADVGVLSWAATTLIYVPLGVAALMLSKLLTRRVSVAAASIVVAMLCGLTFTLSTQLVRQEIAASFICLAIALFVVRKPVVGGAALSVAILTHNSALIPAAAVVLSAFFARGDRVNAWRIIASALGFALLGALYLRVSGNDSYQGKSDGAVSVFTIGLDLLIVSVFLLLARDHGWPPYTRLLAYCTPVFVGFLVGVAAQPLPFLRMYFYLEGLRALMLVVIVGLSLRNVRFRAIAITTAVVLGFLYLHMRIANSPFEYQTGLFEAVFYSPW
ncbi:MAG: hypothetical protein ABS64_06440 [Microbacterium sp. SCN 69-37]|nr:MAG: hypothetical protein ABS64_06440 [Microbacterium sp. SCN 69-37]